MDKRPTINIIQAGIEQVDALTGLFDAYRVFYEQSSDRGLAKKFIAERIEKEDSVIFLATTKEGGEALGFTQLYPSFSSVSMQRLWILNDLYVTRDARGLGVGRALIDRSRQLAIETDAKGLVLETAANNARAKALYDSYGFTRDTEYDRYFLNV